MWFCDTLFSGTPQTIFMDATEVEIPTWLLKECIAELMPTTTDTC